MYHTCKYPWLWRDLAGDPLTLCGRAPVKSGTWSAATETGFFTAFLFFHGFPLQLHPFFKNRNCYFAFITLVEVVKLSPENITWLRILSLSTVGYLANLKTGTVWERSSNLSRVLDNWLHVNLLYFEWEYCASVFWWHEILDLASDLAFLVDSRKLRDLLRIITDHSSHSDWNYTETLISLILAQHLLELFP